MCGRISRASEPGYYIDKLAPDALFEDNDLDFKGFNISPGQSILALRNGGREWTWLRWGLIPSWAKEKNSRLFNARAETAHEKPSFRSAFKKRRCVIPADGYFEWKKREGKKQPYFIYRSDGEPLLLAGIWESWTKGSIPVASCAVLTKPPSPDIADIHHRMPVVLEQSDCDMWLNGENVHDMPPLSLPLEVGVLSYHQVSRRVNYSKNDSADLIEPADDFLE